MNKHHVQLLYLLFLAVTFIVSLTRVRVKGVLFLSIYLLAMLLAEYIATVYLPTGVYNHHIYATGMLITSTLLMCYYAYMLRSLLVNITSFVFFILILYGYIDEHMWRPDTIIPVNYVATHYTMLTAVSVLFVWRTIVQNQYHAEGNQLFFGATSTVYYTVATVNNSILFAETLPIIDSQIIEITFNVLNIIYCVVLSWAFLTINKKIM